MVTRKGRGRGGIGARGYHPHTTVHGTDNQEGH